MSDQELGKKDNLSILSNFTLYQTFVFIEDRFK